MSSSSKSSQANIQFAPDILRRLGEELNPSADQGILELAKNSYDADAVDCSVQLIEHKNGQDIRITDDGDGMNRDDIVNGWLVLGKSSKEIGSVTPLGRRASGNKGLGRLAALRLGEKVQLTTRPRNSKKEFKLLIDWGRYDSATVVEEVQLEVLETSRTEDARHGTTVEIQGVRKPLDRQGVARLARELLLLADPFQDNEQGFQPVLKAPEFRDLEKVVKQRYFDEAELHLQAFVDAQGKVTAIVRDYKGGVLFESNHDEILRRENAGPFKCPAATFDLWIFLLDSTTFATRSASLKDVRDWLGVVGGVHLYMRELRVLPYGEPGHDWLELNLSRVRSPELRPGTNTAVGRIRVEDLAETLIQKTDRTGLIENESYFELRRFAQATLDWLARERLKVRERARMSERQASKKARRKEEGEIEEIVRDLPPKIKRQLEVKLKKLKKTVRKEQQSLHEEVQLYRTLSTAGINAETFAHEAGHPIKTVRENVKIIEQRTKAASPKGFEAQYGRPIGRINSSLDSLEAFTKMSLDFVKREKRRKTRVDLHATIEGFKASMDPLLVEREIQLDLKFAKGRPILFASEAAIESILANHVLNSVKAFVRKGVGKRIIEMTTIPSLGKVCIEIADNGPGIKDIPVANIWLPGESSDPNGTGLGLTIVRDTVTDLSGTIECKPKGRLGGAEFTIELPIVEWEQ